MGSVGRVTASSLLACAIATVAIGTVALAQSPSPATSPPPDPAASSSAAPASPDSGAAPAAAPPASPAASNASTADAATPAPTPTFDAEAATRAWLAKVPAADKERSDAYFEGGYWLELWDLLYTLAVAGLLLSSGLSRRLREMAQRTTRFRPLQTGIYALGYTLLVVVLTYPFTLYKDFFREHRYGLSNQTFGEWMSDFGKGLGVSLVFGTLGLMLLYGVLRRAPKTWWLWGAVVLLALLAVAVILAPVYIAPLFNDYKPLTDAKVRDPILRMAQANGVPAHDVYYFDASKQTKRISANVSGFLGTERVSLNDNLLNRSTLPEIEAVMGHELGHYVLNHVYEDFFELGAMIILGFAFLRATFDRVRHRFGSRWGITSVDDPAGLPLLAALLTLFLTVTSPVLNSIIRSNEAEADAFGLNASRQPDGFASVALKLGEYRKLDPGAIEELLFFDHPSGRNRILMAMRWKAAHPELVEGP
jgi:STE24 endopeptidase